jgi:hypothetical protein
MQRNWLGGGNNKATNPQDWSPNGTPQPGDSLFAEGAVGIDPFPVYALSVKGNDLAGDTLTTFFANVTVNASHRAILNVVDSNGTDTFNLSGRSALSLNVSDIHLIFGGFSTVNMRDDSTLHLTNGGQTTVNVSHNSDWAGGFSTRSYHGGKLTITGGRHATFHNDTSSASLFADVTVPMDVLGKGTFEVSGSARLEFVGSVAKEQSVTVSNDPQFGGGKLVIDHPHQFHGSVILNMPTSKSPTQPIDFARPEVDLQAILNADSYAYDPQKDLLSIYRGNTGLDHLKLINQSYLGFMVEQKPTGIAIVAALAPNELNITPDALQLHQANRSFG